MRETPHIDVVKLYLGKINKLESSKDWNEMLTNAFLKNDIEGLMNFRYALQQGMTKCRADGRLPDDSPLLIPVSKMFLRWTASIDKTIRLIVKKREKYKSHEHKKQTEGELELWLRKKSF